MKKVLPHLLGGLAMMSEFADQTPKKVGYSDSYNFGPDTPQRTIPREKPANYHEKRKKRNRVKHKKGYR